MKKKLIALYLLLVAIYSLFTILYTFYLRHDVQVVEVESVVVEKDEEIETVIEDNFYQDSNITISINTYREYDTDIYVADIVINNPLLLKTALADNSYGRNVTKRTSEIAESVNAILAINGDYYGFRDSGYVMRNSVLYRSSERESGSQALIIDQEGNFLIKKESEIVDSDIENAKEIFSFGPGLVIDGQINVDENSEVDQSMNSNPRTAIGQIGQLHYVFVVSDGRVDSSRGLSLYQLALFMKELNCSQAYNLDGGGTSTMVFNGEIINNVVGGRDGDSERKVSDIVYIGY